MLVKKNKKSAQVRAAVRCCSYRAVPKHAMFVYCCGHGVAPVSPESKIIICIHILAWNTFTLIHRSRWFVSFILIVVWRKTDTVWYLSFQRAAVMNPDITMPCRSCRNISVCVMFISTHREATEMQTFQSHCITYSTQYWHCLQSQRTWIINRLK